jgi:hypothetical protein
VSGPRWLLGLPEKAGPLVAAMIYSEERELSQLAAVMVADYVRAESEVA